MNFACIPALALAGLAFGSPCVADPAALLAPDDPSYSSGWRVPASPMAGLKAFSPAETKDWLQLNRDVTPSGTSSGGMAGMGGGDMKGMKGMGKKSPPGGASVKGGGPMQGMPGMSGMGTMR